MQYPSPFSPILPLQQFIVSISQYCFQQRYFKWQSYIRILKQSQSPNYQLSLQRFVQYYPFNNKYWMQLIQFILKKPKSKAAAVKMYQIALMKNSRSIVLWKNYLTWLKDNISKSDPNYLKAQYQKATKIIGTHYYAAFVFQEYFVLENDLSKKIQSMKKALVSPLKQIDQIYDQIVNYIDAENQGFINNNIEAIQSLVKLEEFTMTESIKNKQKYIEQVKQKLKLLMRKLYQPTKKHVQLRYPYESKLSLDQYRPFQSSYQTWRQYLHFIKNSGNSQFIYPLYQRALIQLCDKQSLWEDYFLILQSQGNYNRVLYLLRSHAKFFQQLSKQIAYYWLEIEERESPQRARQLYIELQRKQNNLQAYMRHIQLQLRAKQYNNAKILYQTILTVFTSNIQIISYIIIQYAQFTIKYFRDIQFSKKLLKTYFQSSPYNEYLFLGYLQFFITHVEYKQNNKDSKQVYEQFMGIVCNGIKRAIQNQHEKKSKIVKKIVNKIMRNYVTSIYLVKAAERRIKQVEFKIFRNQMHNQSLKRSYQELGVIQ